MNTSNAVPWRDVDAKRIEDMIAVLISRLHPETQRIDGSGGDGGRDVQIPAPDGLVIYEVKSFTRRLEKSQRAQIKRSLKKAKVLKPRVWHLVMPLDMTPGELDWYNEVKETYAFMSDFTRGRTWLDSEMAKHPEIARYYLGDSNAEIVKALKEIGQEKAALANGIDDASARIVSLATRLNEIDPHYKFKFSTNADGDVNFEIIPRYAGAELDRPITIKAKISFPSTVEGTSAATRFRDTLHYGVPGEVLGENIHNISVDAPAGFGGEWTGGRLWLSGIHPPVAGEVDFRLITADSSERILSNIPMRIDERYMGSKGGQLHLMDHSGQFKVTMRTNFETRKSNFNFSLSPKPGVLPAVALPTARFWATMRPGNKFSFTIGTADPVEFFSIDEELLPNGGDYYEFLSALARVQQASGVFFPIPEELTESEERALRQVVRLLDGEKQSGTWSNLVLRITKEGLERWRAVNSDNAAPFKAVSDIILRIAGRELYLGRLERVFESAKVAEWPETNGSDADGILELRIIPGASTACTSRIVQ
ncbi:hypothetical protein [Streptomyces sp. SS07]|uniref:hypothetical protein n=1 Tax=Streptomyces sp. SS07 TaxID=2015315 RepID=UPI0011807A48|nr:hypothetical protein [Streptomyces sp. SS07]